MKHFYILLVVASFISCARSQACTLAPDPMPNFNRDQFLGTWYMIEAFPSYDGEMLCARSIYSAGSIMNVDFKYNFSAEEFTDSYTLSDDGILGDSDLEIEGTNPINVVVLDTDYNEFAVVYYCFDCDGSCEGIEILTKRHPINNYDSAIALAHPVVTAKTEFDLTSFGKLNHAGCIPPTKFEQFKQKIAGMLNKGGTAARIGFGTATRNSPITGTSDDSRTGTRHGSRTGTRYGPISATRYGSRTGTRNGSGNMRPYLGRFTNSFN